MTDTKSVPVAQPTTFGRPRAMRDHLFYKGAQRILGVVNKYLFITTVASCFMSLLLMLMLTFFIKHEEVYSSDGTMFSCKIETGEGKAK